MPRLFGTDGVRGLANGDVTADLALSLAQAAARVLGEAARAQGRRPVAVLARDPRISGQFIGAAVAAGLASAGIDVLDAGVIPTPATAYLIADEGADFGVMISASHNPAADNGIKFFAAGGQKLPDELENQIESALDLPPLRPTGADVGRIRRFSDAEDRYVLHLLGSLEGVRLDGLHVVIDSAHGAAAGISPQVFTDAGAQVTVIGNDPNGLNINDGVGSTHLAHVGAAVHAAGADLGIAHDGDADRCLAVDAAGTIVDGDQIMAILATSMARRGVLRDRVLVATVMSNLGLKSAMADADIRVIDTAVGDRYVLEAMNEGGYSLGGEQSGHVIMSRYATTGDGVLTGLQLTAEMARTGRTLAELAAVMDVFPQTLLNVRGVDREGVLKDEVIAAAIASAERELGANGRVLLRPSGTEPMVRVMVEATTQELADRLAQSLAAVVLDRLRC
ncbi:phosphoglucosamine mutase [Rathayibacter toxicus]|uniref:Phosphoglucosamine mutase n=1 Tax=Rathayibacter toxicus TaxID=145458 RepID=A0A0C5BG53_9MICO|nr:phosphoglucosamine mutase [Rathayibacter toxicus]AJM77195.1 phosphoglucosamine mutase [Rathayibacter toxicus]ALS56955.1 phosphoglucosamine mutase [Rathayibacter toxicus]KKM46213.1 phosphoglucosamine mutase [Rathayibacter toxicus]PPG23171.1 phosphoglucosamine mutase [Rathayibacter toxicus]PPG47754.1 phosphoglucosamine mutase [Rathayibacter toxicus]